MMVLRIVRLCEECEKDFIPEHVEDFICKKCRGEVELDVNAN